MRKSPYRNAVTMSWRQESKSDTILLPTQKAVALLNMGFQCQLSGLVNNSKNSGGTKRKLISSDYNRSFFSESFVFEKF